MCAQAKGTFVGSLQHAHWQMGWGVRSEEKDKGSQLRRAGQTDGQTDRQMDGRRGPAVYKVSTFCAKIL